jgi:hypothetical protein
MRKVIFASALCLIAVQAHAQNSGLNLQLPSAPSVFGQDSIRSGDLDCKNAIGGSTQLEFGVTGIVENFETPFESGNGLPSQKDVGVYARIIIPLNRPKERINCNSLYQLELRKRRLEVLRLQEEIEALKALNAQGANQFEN